MEVALAQQQSKDLAVKPQAQTEETEDVTKYVQMYEDAEEAAVKAVKASNRNRDYYDNKQLTAEELAELNRREQPDVIFNIIQPKVEFLRGFEAMNRTDPRAFPRTPKDETVASAATDALRYTKDSLELDPKFSTVWEYMLIEGYGGIELVVTNPETGDIDAVEWEFDRLFHDPHSRKPDFSDARYLGGVVWMDADDAKDLYRGKENIIDLTTQGDAGQRHEDRPAWKTWATGKARKRVRIVQMYHKVGRQWHWCHFTKGGKLDGGPVPFVDQNQESWCPMFLQSAYVDRDNNRYGWVSPMISPQDETNKRRSKALHEITQQRTMGEKGAVDDIDAMKIEMARPDGHIEINPGFEFKLLENTSKANGNIELMQQAMQHVRDVGPNAAMQGKNQQDASGRALLANQQAGQTEIAPLVDRHRQLKRRVYKGIWNLTRQYRKGEWWVRVTDDEDNVKFVGFNRPVTMREEIQTKLTERGAKPEEIEQFIAQVQQDPMRGSQIDQPMRLENVLADMDMDIILEEVPDVANVAEEQFQALVQLAPAVTFPPEIYLEASSLRNKKQLIEKIKAPEPDPVQQQLQAGQIDRTIRKEEAEIEKIKADTLAALTKADQTDAQTGQIIRPQVVDPGAEPPQGMPQQMPQQTPPQQAGF